MSAAGAQIGYADPAALPKGRSPLAHLIHALNQPLTGLQCVLELAVGTPRTAEQHVRTMRDGLELTARMRILVETIREVSEVEADDPATMETLFLDTVLRDTVEDLRPVAETRQIQILLEAGTSLCMQAHRQKLVAWAFRFLESALSLADEKSTLRIAVIKSEAAGEVTVSWKPVRQPPLYSPFSRPELGLLIASVAWKGIDSNSSDWNSSGTNDRHTITLRVPLLP